MISLIKKLFGIGFKFSQNYTDNFNKRLTKATLTTNKNL